MTPHPYNISFTDKSPFEHGISSPLSITDEAEMCATHIPETLVYEGHTAAWRRGDEVGIYCPWSYLHMP